MKNWSLNKKIWGILCLLIAAFVGTVYMALSRMTNIRDALNEITSVYIKRDQMTSVIQDNQRWLTILSRDMILEQDQAKMEALKKSFEEALEKQKTDFDGYLAIGSEEGKNIFAKYRVDYDLWVEELRKSQRLTLAGKDKEAADVVLGTANIIDRMRGYVGAMNDLSAKVLGERSAEANDLVYNAIWASLLVAAVSIFTSVLVAFFVLRALTGAIAGIVKGLSDSSIQVTSAATQIASASEELSQATTEQAASLEETAASVEEMNSMVAKNSENARSAASTSGRSQESVGKGKQIIQKMIDAMESINQSSEGMAETVKVIEQIDKKTKVINEIVNKTELLSFNASVEAARAGEHGKGFAVVAEEVGNLARMSGSAAEEIATLLEESINKVNQMVADTKRSVETGAQVTRECGDVFEEIVQNVNSVSGMATEIASASQEQARGCGEITKAMSQLDQMTQQNAATSEECASAAEELSAQSEALKNVVTQLVVTVNGGGGAQAHFDAQSTHQVAHAAPQKSQAASVVQLKKPKSNGASAPAPTASEPALKKASGDAPHYDSDGFKDV